MKEGIGEMESSVKQTPGEVKQMNEKMEILESKIGTDS